MKETWGTEIKMNPWPKIGAFLGRVAGVTLIGIVFCVFFLAFISLITLGIQLVQSDQVTLKALCVALAFLVGIWLIVLSKRPKGPQGKDGDRRRW
jgi:hypothetical protein